MTKTQDPVMLGRRLAMTARVVRHFTEHRLAEAGANLSTVIIGRALIDEPDLSQRELAERMHIEGPTLVRHLDRLEAAGQVVRTVDGADRRVRRLSLTKDGRRNHRRLERIAARADRDLTAILDDDELSTLGSLLERLADHARRLDDPLATPVPRRSRGSS